MTNEEIMGIRIHQKRIEKGLTMEQLGNLVGVQRSAVNKWEHGIVKNMKRSTIQKLSEILETSPAYLLGWDQKQIDIISEEQQEVLEYDSKVEGILKELLDLDLMEDEAKEVVDYAKYIVSKRK